MLAVSLCHLNGGVKRSCIGPTVAEARAQLEDKQGQPWHEWKLFHGERELGDDDVIEIQVQAIYSTSVTKAIDWLTDLVSSDAFVKDATCCTTFPSHFVHERCDAALAVVSEAGNLTLANCTKILALLRATHLCPTRSFLGNLGVVLAQAFGRACHNPIPFLPELQSLPKSFYIAACSQMALDILPEDHRAKITETVVKECQRLFISASEGLNADLEGDFSIEKITTILGNACRFLGGLGDMTHKHMIEYILGNDHFSGAHEQATDALRLIQAREWQCQVDDHSASRDANANLGLARTSDQLEGQQVGQTETEVELDAAIVQSEQDALQQEQAHLHEAILLSQLEDLPPTVPESSADDGERLVLLTFTRCPKELRETLLASELAAQLVGHGVELEPEYAEGRLVLAEGVTAATLSEAREPWHVVVRVADEGRVYAAIKHGFRSQERPKLKGIGGRAVIPGDGSWFNDASEESEESGSVGAEAFAQLRLSIDVPIKRTFVHFPSETLSPKKAKSAPAEL